MGNIRGCNTSHVMSSLVLIQLSQPRPPSSSPPPPPTPVIKHILIVAGWEVVKPNTALSTASPV